VIPKRERGSVDEAFAVGLNLGWPGDFPESDKLTRGDIRLRRSSAEAAWAALQLQDHAPVINVVCGKSEQTLALIGFTKAARRLYVCLAQPRVVDQSRLQHYRSRLNRQIDVRVLWVDWLDSDRGASSLLPVERKCKCHAGGTIKRSRILQRLLQDRGRGRLYV